MSKIIIIFLSLTFSFYALSAQLKHEVDSLLKEISKIDDSKKIIENTSAIKLISYGDKALKFLASYFIDSTPTTIRSDCQNLFLNKGEIAIIIADRIELMPYALLTGVQNCLLEFCQDNPNMVEYYLTAIRRNTQIFTQKYSEWLKSSERKRWSYRNSKPQNNKR